MTLNHSRYHPPLPVIDDIWKQRVFSFSNNKSLFESSGDFSDNAGLEFIGDSLLSGLLADLFAQNFPKLRPRYLHEIKVRLVNNKFLEKISDSYNLPPQQGCQYISSKWKADLFEAYLAAVYLHRGREVCRDWILALLRPYAIDVYEQLKTEARKNGSVKDHDQCSLSAKDLRKGVINLETFYPPIPSGDTDRGFFQAKAASTKAGSFYELKSMFSYSIRNSMLPLKSTPFLKLGASIATGTAFIYVMFLTLAIMIFSVAESTTFSHKPHSETETGPSHEASDKSLFSSIRKDDGDYAIIAELEGTETVILKEDTGSAPEEDITAVSEDATSSISEESIASVGEESVLLVSKQAISVTSEGARTEISEEDTASFFEVTESVFGEITEPLPQISLPPVFEASIVQRFLKATTVISEEVTVSISEEIATPAPERSIASVVGEFTVPIPETVGVMGAENTMIGSSRETEIMPEEIVSSTCTFAHIIDIDQDIQAVEENSSCLPQLDSRSLSYPSPTMISLNPAAAAFVTERKQEDSLTRDASTCHDSPPTSLAFSISPLRSLEKLNQPPVDFLKSLYGSRVKFSGKQTGKKQSHFEASVSFDGRLMGLSISENQHTATQDATWVALQNIWLLERSQSQASLSNIRAKILHHLVICQKLANSADQQRDIPQLLPGKLKQKESCENGNWEVTYILDDNYRGSGSGRLKGARKQAAAHLVNVINRSILESVPPIPTL